MELVYHNVVDSDKSELYDKMHLMDLIKEHESMKRKFLVQKVNLREVNVSLFFFLSLFNKLKTKTKNKYSCFLH